MLDQVLCRNFYIVGKEVAEVVVVLIRDSCRRHPRTWRFRLDDWRVVVGSRGKHGVGVVLGYTRMDRGPVEVVAIYMAIAGQVWQAVPSRVKGRGREILRHAFSVGGHVMLRHDREEIGMAFLFGMERCRDSTDGK